MFYFLIALILFLSALSQVFNYGREIGLLSKTCLFLGFWLIAGLAYQTGVDWHVYQDVYGYVVPLFDVVSNGGFFDSNTGILAEPGYGLIASFTAMFSSEYQLLQLLLLLLGSVFFFKSLKKYTINYYAVVLLYLGYVYITLNMSGIRQSVALSIMFYALQFILERQFFRFVFFVLIASMIHYTALIFLPLYFILNKRFSIRGIFIVLGVAFTLYVFRVPILTNAVSTFAQYSGNPFVFKIYQYLVLSDELPKISLKMFLNIFMIILLIYRRDEMIARNRYSNIFFNLFVIYIFIGLCLWDTGDIVIRLQHYFVIGLIVIIPEYVMSLRILSNRVIGITYIFILSIWSSAPVFFEQPAGETYNPYQNYVVYKFFDIPSTGEDRLYEWSHLR